MRLQDIEEASAAEQRVKRLKSNAKAAKDRAKQMKTQADVSAEHAKMQRSRQKLYTLQSSSVKGSIKPHS